MLLMVEPVRGIDRTRVEACASISHTMLIPRPAATASIAASRLPRRRTIRGVRPSSLRPSSTSLCVFEPLSRDHRLAGDLMNVELDAIAPPVPGSHDHHRRVMLDRNRVDLRILSDAGKDSEVDVAFDELLAHEA